MKIDHICIAVDDLDSAIIQWSEAFGYKQMTKVVENSRQKVKVVFLKKPDSIVIKLIEPLASNLSLKSFLNKGGSLHHLCFKCADLKKDTTNLREKGLIMVVPPESGEAFCNHQIAFMITKNRLNIELIDTDEKAELI